MCVNASGLILEKRSLIRVLIFGENYNSDIKFDLYGKCKGSLKGRDFFKSGVFFVLFRPEIFRYHQDFLQNPQR